MIKLNKYLSILFFLLSQILITGQSAKASIKVDSLSYYIANQKVLCEVQKVKNIQKRKMILWLSKDEPIDYKRYFYSGDDFPLIELLNENSISNYSISVFSNFIKIIEPNKEFVIYNMNPQNKIILNIYYENELPPSILDSIFGALKVYPDRFFRSDAVIMPKE